MQPCLKGFNRKLAQKRVPTKKEPIAKHEIAWSGVDPFHTVELATNELVFRAALLALTVPN